MRYKPVTARLYELRENKEEFTGINISGDAADMAEGDDFLPHRRKKYKVILYNYHCVIPVFLKEQQTDQLSAIKKRCFC